MTPPRVSAIIPAFQAEAFLAQCITSALDQTVKPAEIIVIDDGSQDGTERVARSFGDRIIFLRQENAGVSISRNRAAVLSRGDFIAFLDSDDYWAPRKNEIQLAAFAADPSLDIVFSHMIEFDTRRGDGASSRYSPPTPARFAGASMIRREAFFRVGLFQPGLKIAEWVDWCLRAKEAGLRERMLADALTFRRIHRDNTNFRQIEHRRNLAVVIKASLDRRRAGALP